MDDTDASALVHAALQHDDEAARALVRQLYPLIARIEWMKKTFAK
jgi:hypothetical protein